MFNDRNDRILTEKLELYSEKLDLYKQVSDEKIAQIQQSLEQSQKTSSAQINAIRFEIKAYQDANKQQLNVSLGVLLTTAVAILVSVILSMTK